MEALCRGSAPYLERGPVHMHPGAVVVAEPLQVLLCVCSQNRALQLSVYCAVAEKKKQHEGTSGDLGLSMPIWQQNSRASKSCSAESEACGVNNLNNKLNSNVNDLKRF